MKRLSGVIKISRTRLTRSLVVTGEWRGMVQHLRSRNKPVIKINYPVPLSCRFSGKVPCEEAGENKSKYRRGLEN